MKVVMVGPFAVRPKGTMARRALPLAKALAVRGHEVELILPPWDYRDDSGREWEEDGVRVHNIALPPSVPLLRETIITWRLLRRVLETHPEVVHCFKPKAYAGLIAAILWGLGKLGLTKVRCVLDSDDWEGWGGWNEILPYSWVEKRLFTWQERWGITHCHALTVASKTLEGLTLEMGVDRDTVHYLPNGVDVQPLVAGGDPGREVRDRWHLGEDAVMLLYTRFFEFEPQRVMEMLGYVWAQEPSARLLVLGRGLFAEEERFLDCAGQAGFASRIAHVGWVQEDELPDYFAASHVAICPFEDTLLNRARCPAKVADLMAAGLAVVADNVGQVGEYVQHLVSGYLVTPGETQGFAEGVIRLLRDEKMRTVLGAEARRRVTQQFGWAQLAAVAERAYRR